MAMKARDHIALYRAGPRIDPPAEIDAAVLGAARARRAPMRTHRAKLVAAATAAAAITLFVVRIATTPSQTFASTEFGREEGLSRVWLANLDLQTPTGPGSQEGLP
jgi:hypothetical protein